MTPAHCERLRGGPGGRDVTARCTHATHATDGVSAARGQKQVRVGAFDLSPARSTAYSRPMSQADRASDFVSLEREIERIVDISAARIVGAPDGRVAEVQIVAWSGRHPQQIARDAESVALAEFGIDIDRRVISVVQLDAVDVESPAWAPGDAEDARYAETEYASPSDALWEASYVASEPSAEGTGRSTSAGDSPRDEHPFIDLVAEEARVGSGPVPDQAREAEFGGGADPPARCLVERVSVHRTARNYEAEVVLNRGGTAATGVAAGFPVDPSIARTVADATLDALRRFEHGAEHLALDRAVLLPVAGLRLALVTVVWIAPPIEEVLAGTSVVRCGREPEAIVRAVLDATNRRLALVG